jgi:outer membrane protein
MKIMTAPNSSASAHEQDSNMKPSSLNPLAMIAAAMTLMAISAPVMAQQNILVIDAEAERLNAETAGITEEGIQQRPDLIQRIQAVSQQAQEFEVTRQRYSNELVATERAAMRPVLEALQAVLQEVVEATNADIIMDRASLVYASQSVDGTADVVERLNARLPTVPVNRVRLPQGDAQQPQQ